jgi:putative glutamine amidotransferase
VVIGGGSACCKVNSLHRQAVDRPGRGLTVVAHDLDGVTQGIEDVSARFRIGAPWQPEYLAWQARQRRLFAALATAARRAAQKPSADCGKFGSQQ